eukprot:5925984-Amphidinium_carterae.1
MTLAKAAKESPKMTTQHAGCKQAAEDEDDDTGAGLLQQLPLCVPRRHLRCPHHRNEEYNPVMPRLSSNNSCSARAKWFHARPSMSQKNPRIASAAKTGMCAFNKGKRVKEPMLSMSLRME